MAQMKTVAVQPGAQADPEDTKAVVKIEKAPMELAPSDESMGRLTGMVEMGLLPRDVMTEAALIYMSIPPENLKDLKVRHLVDAARRTVNGEQLGIDFYLMPKIGVYESSIGVQKELGKQGMPPATENYRLMTPEEREQHKLKDAEDIGVVATLTWPDLNGLTVEGIGVVSVDDMYSNRLSWPGQGQRPVPNPRDKWQFKDPPKARTWMWVAQKRAHRAAMQRVRGFTVVTPEKRVAAAREQGIQVDPTFDGKLNYAQAQAAVNQTAVLQAQVAADKDVMDLLGEEAYRQLAIARLKRNQALMYGDGDALLANDMTPEEIAAVAGAEPQVTAVLVAPTVQAAPEADSFADDAVEALFSTDDDADDDDGPALPADTDILQDLRDNAAALVAEKPEWAGPASQGQSHLLAASVAKAIADVSGDDLNDELVLALVERISGGRPLSQAMARAAMRTWLHPTSPFPLKPEGVAAIRVIYDAYKASLAGESA